MPSSDLKRQGEVAELLFLYRAAALGLTVSKPYGDNAKYDFLVDAGGHLTRVQVKSVSVPEHGAYRVCSASGGSRRPRDGASTRRAFRSGKGFSGTKAPYTAAEIDLLAAYIIPEDAWYLIPVSAFAPVQGLRLRPGSNRKFERFRDAWHLLYGPQRPSRAAAM